MDTQATYDLEQLYQLLAQLEDGLGGKRILGQCNGSMEWPCRGVYFFFEPGELRSGASDVQRVVRVGTHGLQAGTQSTLWGRLHDHRGYEDGGGNHRGSVFRKHVGAALLNEEGTAESLQTWGVGSSATPQVTADEHAWEVTVSGRLGNMSLLWLDVPDDPGPGSARGVIESNSIALLSTTGNEVDFASGSWLGNWSSADAIQESGLWNVCHTADAYDPEFLEVLEDYVSYTLEPSATSD